MKEYKFILTIKNKKNYLIKILTIYIFQNIKPEILNIAFSFIKD